MTAEKSISLSNKKAHNKQRNTYTSLLRKTWKQYYSNFNVKNVVDNKKCRKIVKTFFSDKSRSFKKYL